MTKQEALIILIQTAQRNHMIKIGPERKQKIKKALETFELLGDEMVLRALFLPSDFFDYD